MSTYKRSEGDLAIQVYLPRDLGLEIGKLRLESRSTNNVVITELLVEALRARGVKVSDPVVAPPKPKPEPKPSKGLVPRGQTAADRNPEFQAWLAKEAKASKSGSAAKSTAKAINQPGPQVQMDNPVTSLAQLPKPKSLAQKKAEKEAKAAQEKLARREQAKETRRQNRELGEFMKASLAQPAPAPVTEVSVADSVSVEDVAEVAAQEPVVAPAPLDDIDSLLLEAIQDAPVTIAAPAADNGVTDEWLMEMVEIYAPEVEPAKVEPAPAAEEDDEEYIDFGALSVPDDEKLVLDPFKLVT